MFSEEFKKNRSKQYTGSGNPFYGKKHSKESLKLIAEKHKDGKFKGENNPFFGKKHSKELQEQIIKSQKEYYSSNDFKKKCFNKIGLNVEELKNIFEEYVENKIGRKHIYDKYKIDFRTLEKYFRFFGFIENEEEYSLLKKRKQKSISFTEDFLYEQLVEFFGQKNIIRQYRISYYRYDFIIFNKFLIEFDGSYWHSFEIAKKRDEIKNLLANHHDLILFRIKEVLQKKYDYRKELEEIKDKINEIQIKEN